MSAREEDSILEVEVQWLVTSDEWSRTAEDKRQHTMYRRGAEDAEKGEQRGITGDE